MKRFESLLVILFLSLSVYNISAKLLVEKTYEEPRASLNFQNLQSCEMHGGISCSKGKDTDGSVICANSYKAVPVKYDNFCINNLPILSVVSVSEKLFDGSYMLMLKNNSRFDTGKIKLSFQDIDNRVVDLASVSSLAGLEGRAFRIDASLIRESQKPTVKDFIISLNGHRLIR